MTPDTACDACRERLLEYVANALPETQHDTIAAHLTSCDTCRREHDQWRSLRALVVASDRDVPADHDADAGWSALHNRLAPLPLLARGSFTERRDIDDDSLDTPALNRARTARADVSRRRPYVAVAAFLLIVTLAVAVFSLVGTHRDAHNHSVATTPQVTTPACALSQLRAETPPYSSIRSVSMISATDGWAVGDIWNWQSPTPPATLIMRFHDCVWTQVGQSIPSAWMFNVSMSANGDGWAVGGIVRYLTHPADNSPNSITTYEADTLQVFALRLIQGQWRQVTTPVSDIQEAGAQVHMTSATDGWMLVDGGKSHTDPYTIAEAETVLHYSDGAWTVVPTPFKTPGMSFWDLTTVTAGECWIAAYDTNTDTATIAHYQNGHWQTWSPAPSSDNYAQIMSIGVVNARDVWAVSETELFHFDGSAWKVVQLPPGPPAYHGLSLGKLIIRSATDGWILHDNPGWKDGKLTGALVLHFDGAQWQWVSLPAVIDMGNLTDFALVSDTQGWAAGDGFTATSAGPVERAKFVYYDHGVWTELPS
jgi:hypothetical protein